MYCSNCGKDIGDSNFCPECGTPAARPLEKSIEEVAHSPNPPKEGISKASNRLPFIAAAAAIFIAGCVLGSGPDSILRIFTSDTSSASASDNGTKSDTSIDLIESNMMYSLNKALSGTTEESNTQTPSQSEAQPSSNYTSQNIQAAPDSYATAPFSATLEAGYYIAGVDFPAGTYDISHVRGSGIVRSSNMNNGGVSEMVGTEKQNQLTGGDQYVQECKNVDLPNGTVLSVLLNLNVQISSDAASTAPLTPRNQSITETIHLDAGNYVAGVDFPAGIYDITAVSSHGNVTSSNSNSGGINTIMGTKAANKALGEAMDYPNGYFYNSEYHNVSLPQGTTLLITRVEVELTPSK